MNAFSEAAGIADQLLAEFGDIVTRSRTTTSGDPWAATTSTSDAQITAVIMPAQAEDRAQYVEADAIAYCRPGGGLLVGDKITRGSESWRVTQVSTYSGQGSEALYVAGLKWAS